LFIYAVRADGHPSFIKLGFLPTANAMSHIPLPSFATQLAKCFKRYNGALELSVLKPLLDAELKDAKEGKVSFFD